MIKSCFVIPIYPPHYHYLCSYEYRLPSDKDFDVYLILSFFDDKTMLPKSNKYNVIVLEEYLDKDFIQSIVDKKSIITFKKYFALEKLYKKYKYITAVDAEIEFKNIHNIYESFDDISKRRAVFGAPISPVNNFYDLALKVNKTSGMFFKNNFEIAILKNKTLDFTLFFWFSDIPVYDCHIIPLFLDYINFSNYKTFVDKINFFVFDYISYVYYCMIYYDWKIINIRDYNILRNWSLEGCSLEVYNSIIKQTNFKLYWINHCYYIPNDETKDIVLTYHIDRDENHVLAQMPNI
jgi:hypothetical protein